MAAVARFLLPLNIDISVYTHESSVLRIPVQHLLRETNRFHACRCAMAPVALTRMPTAVGFQPVAIPRRSTIELDDLVGYFVPDSGALNRSAIHKTIVVDSTERQVAPIRAVVR